MDCSLIVSMETGDGVVTVVGETEGAVVGVAVVGETEGEAVGVAVGDEVIAFDAMDCCEFVFVAQIYSLPVVWIYVDSKCALGLVRLFSMELGRSRTVLPSS